MVTPYSPLPRSLQESDDAKEIPIDLTMASLSPTPSVRQFKAASAKARHDDKGKPGMIAHQMFQTATCG